jgi:hypothetical protein
MTGTIALTGSFYTDRVSPQAVKNANHPHNHMQPMGLLCAGAGRAQPPFVFVFVHPQPAPLDVS